MEEIDRQKEMQRIWDKATPIVAPCLKGDYIFWFGKHKGVKVSDVKKVDPDYIMWFEMNIPIERW